MSTSVKDSISITSTRKKAPAASWALNARFVISPASGRFGIVTFYKPVVTIS